ncbi:Type II toxin-antitoxin system HipA family toxin [Methylorubrum aminovorans]
MDRDGTWGLSPAYDITWSYNPLGDWTSKHQMSVNGKWDGFSVEDFRETGRRASLRRGRATAILDEVVQAVRRWPDFAAEAGVSDPHREQVAKSLRLDLPDK